MGELTAEAAALLNNPQRSDHQKDLLRLALFLMAKGKSTQGLEALAAGDGAKVIQLVKDYFMQGIPEDRRRAAEEAVDIFPKAASMATLQAAQDISRAMQAYMEINRYNPTAYVPYENISTKGCIWLGGYIAGVRQERRRRRR